MEPALLVPCPDCQAGIGRACVRPSGHPVFGGGVHRSRDQAALDAGVLKPCTALTWDDRHARQGAAAAARPAAKLRADDPMRRPAGGATQGDLFTGFMDRHPGKERLRSEQAEMFAGLETRG